MYKIIVLVKRKPGMSMADFKDYYENNHAVLALKTFANVTRYTRNYLTPIQNELCADGEPPFDCVTESAFETKEDFDKAMANLAEHPEQAAAIEADELNLFDRPSIWWFTAEECNSAV